MYRAEGVVRKSIHDFKYEGRFYWVKVLTQWLEEGFNAWAGSEPWDALVPVPLHVLRLRERGFNQARELARTLGQRVSLPCWDVLVRNKETTSQTYLERHQRLRNMRKAFHLKQPDWWGRFDVEGKNLLIIDDVFTTGATTDACARVLRKHGAARVAALTIARG
jgi:ComF family protein